MTHLESIPARTIVRAIADAAQRWSDADFPPRVRILERIRQRTGYSTPTVDYALDRLFESITVENLTAVIADELGGFEALDGLAARDGRPNARAAPVGTVCVISSRTTVGVALPVTIFALCAKCDVTVKDREDGLCEAFFATLCEELDVFAEAARASAWDSNTLPQPALREFDAVVAYGNDETLEDIRRGLRADARFIGYGLRCSGGYVAHESLLNADAAGAAAAAAARDLVLYESEGCLSLHVLFVERGAPISVPQFGRVLADAVELANVEFPALERPPAAAAQVAARRDLARFRAARASDEVFSNANADYAVILGDPADPPSFLPRTLALMAVDAPEEAVAYVRSHHLPLEAFALSHRREDLVRAAFDSGAVAIPRLGELQQPPLAGHHGGRARIAEFVRWIDETA